MQDRKNKYKSISINDGAYPSRLKEIPQPPKVLHIRGSIPSAPMIGVVGTRTFTPYGKRVAEHIVRGLARAGVCVVSGMARGIDTEAHKAALESGGQTIAVVGSGIDESVIYPRQNIGLAREIEKHGAVLSEFDPFAKSETYFFPQRNRVISGLSLGVLVVEAKEKSGALITANFALEQNREVFAVPGSIFWETSRGPNNLIKQGAKCVTTADEILEEFNLLAPEQLQINTPANTPIEEKILAMLLKNGGNSVHIDKLITLTELSSADVSSSLTIMELEDRVKNLGGGYYAIMSQ
ncbi:MAG: DNA protecting protein DprA [Candidatus Spechtbacteria bacterium RIFCSPHIGHO2_01_FULL_43_30]|uniref:DNA protecting protein DprA n=1 Tax=Candidatus Spechtbacteria bacterium RIFCSPHIGHO2_01_FULL_43_30 TaxID=1802158 RepID=A0A1G2H9W8_9BACT|nr:MAG: DNA protecting protein DprA [Candidatus Spechtbacteria bacterium RIFCSPHIGHO2_01_FULL_43_30]